MSIIDVEQLMKSNPAGARLPHDPKYEYGIAFLNGKYCTQGEAVIPFFDMGVFQADATYEVSAVSRGRFFRLQDHFDRFARSCKEFRLSNPHTETEMREIFSSMLRTAGLKDAGIYWCVTRGLPKLGANSIRDRNKPEAFENRFYAATYPYGGIATQDQRNRGMDVLVSETYFRIPPRSVNPIAKNFHWMDMKLALFEARDQGKDWVVLTDADGYLTECAGANIFFIQGGELYTPDSGCLEGITRQTALDLAQIMGIPTHVERVHADQLRNADDAFITSTAGGIMPVNSVDSRLLGGTQGPGELSSRFHNLYWEKMWEGWKCTPVDYRGPVVTAAATA